jgi:enoyl-CoA hydratase/carnithine racemase
LLTGNPIFYRLEDRYDVDVFYLTSEDGTNRLTGACMRALAEGMRGLASEAKPLVITGNKKFFSAGAELSEIAALSGSAAYEFSRMGQELMNCVADFPAPVIAAVDGYCMGGGLDLALACHGRIASPHAIFGHRGAALGLVTGWGGTQRLPRLVGKAKALEMLIAAEKIHATEALRIGLVNAVVKDPIAEALRQLGLGTIDGLRAGL